jgi:hypothetical protein
MKNHFHSDNHRGGDFEFQELLDYRRASYIEILVCKRYCDDDTDAADLALDEIRINPNRSDELIAHVVAQRILQP